MFNQILEKVMGKKCVPLCLTVGYQEETDLVTQELLKYFPNEECLLIK